MRHLTLRVAWHDRAWDGHVCSNPSENSFDGNNAVTAHGKTYIPNDNLMYRSAFPDALSGQSIQDAKNRFSSVVEAARRTPQTVNKHGKPAVVVLSADEYARLRHIEHVQVLIEPPRAYRFSLMVIDSVTGQDISDSFGRICSI